MKIQPNIKLLHRLKVGDVFWMEPLLVNDKIIEGKIVITKIELNEDMDNILYFMRLIKEPSYSWRWNSGGILRSLLPFKHPAAYHITNLHENIFDYNTHEQTIIDKITNG
jgi:hypothetical protein